MHLQSLNQRQAQSLALYPTCHHLFSLTEERGDKGEEFVQQIISKICEISLFFPSKDLFFCGYPQKVNTGTVTLRTLKIA